MPSKQIDKNGDPGLTPDQRRVLEDAYQRLADLDRWPTYAELDHDGDRHGVEDPLSVMRSLSPTYLLGLGQTGVPSLQQELSLPLIALAAVAGWNAAALHDLDVFAKSVQGSVAISDATTPPNAARFSALDFLASFTRGDPSVSDVIRLGCIWNAAGASLWDGLTSAGTVSWEAHLNQQNLRAYRRVQDVKSLLRLEQARLTAQAGEQARVDATLTPRMPYRKAAEDGCRWTDLLPDGFREVVAHRVAEHGADAINAGWIELAELIHRKSAIDLDGEDLINQAFAGKTPRVRLADDSKTGDNLHQGYTDLMRGLARMRIAQSHRGRPAVSELHVAAAIMTMGECYAAVSRAAAVLETRDAGDTRPS